MLVCPFVAIIISFGRFLLAHLIKNRQQNSE